MKLSPNTRAIADVSGPLPALVRTASALSALILDERRRQKRDVDAIHQGLDDIVVLAAEIKAGIRVEVVA